MDELEDSNWEREGRARAWENIYGEYSTAHAGNAERSGTYGAFTREPRELGAGEESMAGPK